MKRQEMKPVLAIVSLCLILEICLAGFPQPYAGRYLYSTSPPVAEWQIVPFESAATLGVTSPRGWDGPVIQTSNSLYLISEAVKSVGIAVVTRLDTVLNIVVTSATRVSVAAESGLVVHSSEGLYLCPSSALPCKQLHPSPVPGTVNDIAQCLTGELWVAATSGLYYATDVDQLLVRLPFVDESVLQVACGSASLKTTVAVNTPLRVWRNDGPHSQWRFEWTHGNIEDTVNAMAFHANGELWIASDDCISKQLPPPNRSFVRIGALDGLPFANVTSLAADAQGNMWAGTVTGGLMMYEGAVSQWRVFRGDRWMAGLNVRAVTVDNEGVGAWALTDLGIAHIVFHDVTLEQKAIYFQSLMPTYLRNGQVGGVTLANYGDLRKYTQDNEESEGLWTGMYLASQCFRYAVTKDPAVKATAWETFEAMEILYNVTGVTGLMARQFAAPGSQHPTSGNWRESLTMPGYWWEGATSSDEVCAHMMVYPLVHDLLAETEEEKARAVRLIDDTVRYITENGYYLIDSTGNKTRWGVWAPEVLNVDFDWSEERGLNSMQMLSWLLSAFLYTGDDYFLQHFDVLRNEHGYADNMVNERITQPIEVNFGDDELGFLTLFLYSYISDKLPSSAAPNRYALDELSIAYARNWKQVETEKTSLYNIMYRAAGSSAPSMNDAIWCLQRWPLETINWPYKKSDRSDIRISPYPNRNGQYNVDTVVALPPDERAADRWNENYYNMDGGSGFGADDPGAWLLPYWMGRYYKLIND